MTSKTLSPEQMPGFDLDDPMHHWALNLINHGAGAMMGPHALGVARDNWPVFVRRLVDAPEMQQHKHRPPLDPGELAGWNGRDPDHHMAMWLLAGMYSTLPAEAIAAFRERWPEGVAALLETYATLRASVKPSPLAALQPQSRAARRAAKTKRPGWWPWP